MAVGLFGHPGAPSATIAVPNKADPRAESNDPARRRTVAPLPSAVREHQQTKVCRGGASRSGPGRSLHHPTVSRPKADPGFSKANTSLCPKASYSDAIKKPMPERQSAQAHRIERVLPVRLGRTGPKKFHLAAPQETTPSPPGTPPKEPQVRFKWVSTARFAGFVRQGRSRTDRFSRSGRTGPPQQNWEDEKRIPALTGGSETPTRPPTNSDGTIKPGGCVVKAESGCS